MMPDWLSALADEGTTREVAGNAPLWLDDPDSAWLVRSGPVDVFAVPPPHDGVAGARRHLFRAEVGQLLCGVAGPQDRPRLLAVGGPGSQVVSLRREQLVGLTGRPELAALVNGWVRGLTAGVAHGRAPGKVKRLEAGKQLELAAGGATSPARRILWARHVQGASCFLGKAELPLKAEDGFVPLTAASWLVAGAEGARLEVVTTEALLGDPGWGAALDRFHRLVLACVALNLEEAGAAERARLERRAESDRRLREATLFRLAHAAQPKEEEEVEAGPEGGALLAACRLVGARLGAPMQAPLVAGENRRRSDPVAAIARASRVRARRVLLKDDWWRRDNGPLLAFRADDERPVALLPASPSRYELVDPAAPAPVPLTAANASSVLPFAYSFYRPFGARAMTAWELFRFSLKGTRRDWLAVVLLGLAGSLLGLLTPLVTGWVFDRIIPGAERSQLLLVVLALAASAVAVALFQLTRNVAVLRLETKMEGAVQAGLWDRLLDLPAPFFRRYTAGDLADRSLGIAAIRQVLTDVALSAVLSLVFSLVSFGLLFYYDVRLALLACGLFAVVLLATGLGAYLQWRHQRGLYPARGKVAGLVLQLITGLSRLRVAAAEDRALAAWAKEFSVQRRLAFRARSVGNNLSAFNAAAPLLATLALFAAVAPPGREGLSLGSFLAFNVAFVQVLGAALTVSSLVGYAAEVFPLQERARPILQAPPEVDASKAHPGELSGDIEISHVSFRYQADGPLVLDDLSVHIRPGEFVAFVGPSGAGKSTIIRLLLGFEAPASGSIFYDRLDLSGLDLQAVRRQMGVVLQDGKVLAGDLLSNISGSAVVTQEEAWEAATLAGLDEDIERMPMGLYTVVGEGGTTLSGGQRQRLLIARAVVAKPRALLFDEATSALDNETQARVSRSLERLKATRVVVAHRLSTVRQADRIYVLERGRVVQSGTYEELMGQGGLFAELAQRQLA
jgi:NHLM bacteriocin system ABC transporter ATP-binding protein